MRRRDAWSLRESAATTDRSSNGRYVMTGKQTARIEFQCPNCESQLRVAAKAAGKRIRCPECAKVVPVPLESEVEGASVEPSAPELRWLWLAGGGAALV